MAPQGDYLLAHLELHDFRFAEQVAVDTRQRIPGSFQLLIGL